MSEPVIEIKNLTFSYEEHPVFQNASLNIKRGDFACILGANGTGKSTLLKLILNILQPDSGTITVLGKSPKTRAKIAYVSQRATAFNTGFPATAIEIVQLGLYKGISFQFSRAKKKELTERALKALDSVGMYNYAFSPAGQLSGGQQQRVFLARALVSEPEILFLDEPTTGIDAGSADNICCILGGLNKRLGITILMVTHDMPLVASHANKIIDLTSDGKIDVFAADSYKITPRHSPSCTNNQTKGGDCQ